MILLQQLLLINQQRHEGEVYLQNKTCKQNKENSLRTCEIKLEMMVKNMDLL